MAENKPIAIEPRAAPLSHLKKENTRSRAADGRTLIVVGLVVLTAVSAYYLSQGSFLVDVPERASQNATSSADLRVQNETQALPFEQTQQRIARDRAQEALAKFVEQQIYLENHMQVAAWGQAELTAALATAEQGDLEFARDNFDAAIAAYADAEKQLAALIDLGNEKVNASIQEAITAIDARDQVGANRALAAALAIEPKHNAIGNLQARLATLPAIIDLFRDAKNHELAFRFADALTAYNQIQELDSETIGLSAAKDAVQQGATTLKLEQTLSRGFTQLNQGNFDAARNAFNQALAIDPNDSIAQGGLQQVARAYDLNVIEEQREIGERAMSSESWDQAIAAYETVLELDKNIQFASAGLTAAKAHKQTSTLLTAINAQPARLSSQTLYLQAQEILSSAKSLSHRGRQLDELIDNTDKLLVQYKDPVLVHLISDSRTDVIVSNVGRLGYFAEKELSLRPGEYTFRGSQDGCRDLYLSVLVVPGIESIDLRCQERL